MTAVTYALKLVTGLDENDVHRTMQSIACSYEQALDFAMALGRMPTFQEAKLLPDLMTAVGVRQLLYQMTINPAILQISDCILCEKEGAMVLAEVKEVVLDHPRYLKLVTKDAEQTHFSFYFDDSTKVELMPVTVNYEIDPITGASRVL